MPKRRQRKRDRFSGGLTILRMIILLACPFLAALDYGGVLPWTQWALGCAALSLLVLAIPTWFRSQPRPRVAMLTAIALLVATGALLQTIRLPNFITAIVSRGSNWAHQETIPEALRKEALQSGDANLQRLAAGGSPVSLSPSRTLAACTIPILFSIFLLGSASTFDSEAKVVIMLFALAASGATISFIGISDRLRPDESQQFEKEGNNDVVQKFATFVNRNSASVYLNLTLAAAAGCLIWRYSWQRKRRPWEDRFEFDEATLLDRAKKRLQQLVEYVDTPIVLMLIISGVILAGLLIGGSRGAVLGAVAGSIIFVIRAVSKQETRTFAAITAAGTVLLAVMLGSLGSLQQIRARTSTIWTEDFSESARFGHWRDAVPTALHYLPAGAGLGAYRYAYLPYQQHSSGSWFQNADNLYLEVLVEGGLWLPLLLILGSAIVLSALLRLARIKKSPTTDAIVVASWYLIASMSVSQFFDFGVLLPANYLTIAILMGALLGHADQNLNRARRRVRMRIPRKKTSVDDHATRESKPVEKPRSRQATSALHNRSMRLFSHRLANPLLALLLLAYLWVITNDAKARANVDYWRRTTAHIQAGNPTSTLVLPPPVQQLAADRPTDTGAQLTAANWRLLVYRSGAVRTTFEQPNVLAETSSAAWRNSEQPVIRAIIHTADQADRQRLLSTIVRPDELTELRNARNNALTALLASPLDVAARELLIQLDYLDPSATAKAADKSRKLFEQIKRLRSRHSASLHGAAKLAYIHPGKETAFSLWRHAFEIDPDFLDDYWWDAEQLVDEETFMGAVPRDPYLTLRFAELAKQPHVREQMLDRAQQLLLSTTPSPENVAKHHYSLGRVAEMKQDFRAAEKHYAAAVVSNQTATDWRYRYVLALDKNGRKGEALDQIERCLVQDPENVVFQRTKLALTKR